MPLPLTSLILCYGVGGVGAGHKVRPFDFAQGMLIPVGEKTPNGKSMPLAAPKGRTPFDPDTPPTPNIRGAYL